MTTKIKTFTGSGSFDVREEMLKDSTDLLDNVEVTTIAQECVKLKAKEDEIAKLEEQLKSKKAEADDISSRVIPELLAEQGLSEIKLADGSKVSVKKEYRCTLPKDESKRAQCYDWLRDQNLGDIIKNTTHIYHAAAFISFNNRIGKAQFIILDSWDDKYKILQFQKASILIEDQFKPLFSITSKSDIVQLTLNTSTLEVLYRFSLPYEVLGDYTKVTVKFIKESELEKLLEFSFRGD